MNHPAPNSLESGTRERLLNAAGEVFADRGFRDSTVREICGAAGVNIAAVNYHFGDKVSLYREVIKFAGCAALEKYPASAGLDPSLPAADRLRAFVRNYLDRLLDEGRPAWHGRLIAREMVEPTPVLDELVEGFVRPQYERVRDIVTELLGPAATDERVRLCVTSVVGQCLFFKNCRPVLERLLPAHRYDSETRGKLAAHIASFSLGAIAAVRADAEREGGP
jgi:AcrR family transcriptional regulator